MDNKAKKKKIFLALIIGGFVFIVIGGLYLLGIFQFLESKVYDLQVRFWANTTYNRRSEEIMVILLDQDSLDWAQKERGWGWPWPRQAYAEIVDYMNLGKAHGIAFDVIFSEPSIYRNSRQDEIIETAVTNLENVQTAVFSGDIRSIAPSLFAISNSLHSLSAREDDGSFIEASRNFGKVVQVVMFSNQTGSVNSWPSNINKPLFIPENFGSFLEKFTVGAEIGGAQFPIQGLMESAGAIGSVTGLPDPDGIIRRIKPFTYFDGKAVPGLSTALLALSGMDPHIRYNERSNEIQWEWVTIPVDKNGDALLRFRGDFRYAYNPIRAMDVLLSAESVRKGENPGGVWQTSDMGTRWILYPPENFRDAYVFFGFYAQGLYDIFSTPVSSVYPGMGVHITMLDNILKGDFIRESPVWVNLFILLIIVASVVAFSMFSQKIPVSVGGVVFVLLIIIAGAFLSYQFAGFWLPMVTVVAGALASFITVTIYNYATEGSQKRFIKSAFSQYLSPKVIEQIIQDPSQLKLGGEKREMTAIFTDIRGFSTFSEALGDPSKLVNLLNFYLTKMSDIVLDNQGTIDKYEGDAIIAFFGAPIHYENHAALACRAAIGMKKAEPAINREAIESGLITKEVIEAMFKKGLTKGLDDPCQIFTRIGLNTGDMVVGNMGTPNKMDYTIMGNAVNLAARLEGVNKQYNTGGILISEYSRAHIGDEFILRPLSRVRVVGINTPLRLYELLDTAEEASPELLDMVKNWEQAFGFYEKRDFIAAKNIFQTICMKNSEDNAAKKYLDRCAKFAASPPDEKAWDDGVDNLTEK